MVDWRMFPYALPMQRDDATERRHQRHASHCCATHTMALATDEEKAAAAAAPAEKAEAEAAAAAATAARNGTSACFVSSLEDDPPARASVAATVGSGRPSKPVVPIFRGRCAPGGGTGVSIRVRGARARGRKNYS